MEEYCHQNETKSQIDIITCVLHQISHKFGRKMIYIDYGSLKARDVVIMNSNNRIKEITSK